MGKHLYLMTWGEYVLFKTVLMFSVVRNVQFRIFHANIMSILPFFPEVHPWKVWSSSLPTQHLYKNSKCNYKKEIKMFQAGITTFIQVVICFLFTVTLTTYTVIWYCTLTGEICSSRADGKHFTPLRCAWTSNWTSYSVINITSCEVLLWLN